MKRLVIFVLSLICGFQIIHAEPIGNDNYNIRITADLIMQNLMDAMNANNYSNFSKDFGNAMKSALNEEKFFETKKLLFERYGQYMTHEYMGYLTQQNMTVVMYKSRYTKTKEDLLVKMVLSKENGKITITGLWFQ